VWKFFEVFTRQVKYTEDTVTKQYAEHRLQVKTQSDNIEKKNITKPWSAPHRQRHSGNTIEYPSAHKDLPLPATTPDQVKTKVLEHFEAVVEVQQLKEIGEIDKANVSDEAGETVQDAKETLPTNI
jgi:hypothetical protein